jgi:signal transduction histidine kinase
MRDAACCRELGAERAKLAKYKAGQILTEFKVLREALVEHLEANVTLSTAEHKVIFEFIEMGAQDAVDVFSANVPSQRELQQALEMRDEFLSVASHELKTPLSVLRLQLQLIQRQAVKNSTLVLNSQQLVEKLKLPLHHVDRLVEMLDRLLDLSRIRTNRLRLEVTAVDLCGLTQDVVTRLRPVAEARGSQIHIQQCQPIIAYVDAIRIEQVITNLLTNALKYGAGKPVSVQIASSGERATLQVQDQGIGISEDDLPRIFERFERATATGQKESLGLGLFITREIIQAHHGFIRAESEVGHGSMFEIELPLRELDTSVNQQLDE